MKFNYPILAILFIDGDHSALCSALLAGLFDADVSDIGEVTQGLQLLDTQYMKRLV